MTKEDYEKFRKNWEEYMEKGMVFNMLKGTIRTIKHLPDNDFDSIWEQLSKQMDEIRKHEINEHSKTGEKQYTDIGDVYTADFQMIYRILDYLGKTWPDLYNNEILVKLKEYIKYYEEKYSFNMFK